MVGGGDDAQPGWRAQVDERPMTATVTHNTKKGMDIVSAILCVCVVFFGGFSFFFRRPSSFTPAINLLLRSVDYTCFGSGPGAP